jgi:hypothetical protein
MSGVEDRGQEAGMVAGAVVSVAGTAGGVASARRVACQWSGRRSLSRPAGVVGKRVSTSCRYAHGSTPSRWHVDVKLKSTAAVCPPRGDPTVNQFLRLCGPPHNRNYADPLIMRSRQGLCFRFRPTP